MARWDPLPPGTPGRMGLVYRLRFYPQTLVFLAAFWLAFFGLRDAIGAGIYWWWGPTYRQVDFVMEEAAPNDGIPIIRGRLDPGDEGAVLEARLSGAVFTVTADPGVTFEAGRRIRVWWSPEAPIAGLGSGRSTQYMPVSALPRLPGMASLLGNLALAAAPLVGAVLVVGRFRALRTRTIQGERLLDGGPDPPGRRDG